MRHGARAGLQEVDAKLSGPGLEAYLALSGVLFGIGLWGLLSQRGALMVLMSIEIVMNASLLAIVAAWRFVTPQDYSAQVFFLIGVTIGAVEMSAGLAIMLLGYRARGSQQIDYYRDLHG